MKKKIKLFLTLVCSATAFLCVGAGCAQGVEGPLGEGYDFIFDKPYASTPDETMEIDGFLEEDVWKDKNYLTQSLKDCSWAATTHFTDKGLYIAVEATDITMSYKTRYTSRSLFDVYICKTGTECIYLNSTAYNRDVCQQFVLDPYYCRSKCRIPYYYNAQVKGELNSETECTMTAELFLSWKDLYYTEEELGEKGYPDSIQMYINYEGETNEVLGSCLWRQETYFHYNENGLIGAIEHQDLGNATNGLAATDQWTLNQDGKLQTTAGRTQIVWLKNAYAKDFMFEAELKPLGTRINANGSTETISLRGDKVYGSVGLVNAVGTRADFVTQYSQYSVFSADARSICDRVAGSKSIALKTYRQMDSFHWANMVGKSETVETGYMEDTVTLRIIKQGDNFYYFYGDQYWQNEQIPNLQEEVFCGIYTSQGVVVEDYKFIDYTDKDDELEDELKKYIYYIEVAGEMTRGSVSTSTYAVAKGKEVTITFQPKAQNILTDITRGMDKQNAVSVYDEVYPLLNEKNEYTFIPTSDIYIGAEYTSFPKSAIVKTIITFLDEQENKVMDANYEITGNNKRLYYTGQPNASGNIIISLPKKGEYQIAGEEFYVSGEYTLTATFNGHHTYKTTFTLDENTPYDEKGQCLLTYTLDTNAWGAVVVNGKTVTGAGSLKFNEETSKYYTETTSRVYFKDMVAQNYVANVTLSITNGGEKNGDLIGLMITDGSTIIILKFNLENQDKIILATGNETTDSVAGREYAIGGFKYTTYQEPYGTGNNGCAKLSIKVVKCGNAIYIFDCEGVLKVCMNQNGVNLVNGASYVWGATDTNKEAINNDIKSILKGGEKKQTALGLYTLKTTSLWAEMDVEFSTSEEDIYTDDIEAGELIVNLPEDRTLETEIYPVRKFYGMREIVEIGIKVADAQNVRMRMLIMDKNGISVIEGKYDWVTECIVFKFEYAGGDTTVSTAIITEGDMDWSEEWFEDWTPDKENTGANQSP